jgi:hypothetical protein
MDTAHVGVFSRSNDYTAANQALYQRIIQGKAIVNLNNRYAFTKGNKPPSTMARFRAITL